MMGVALGAPTYEAKKRATACVKFLEMFAKSKRFFTAKCQVMHRFQ